MNYQTDTIPEFEAAVKRLSRKYRRIKKDIFGLDNILGADPYTGQVVQGFDSEVWKIRMANSDMKRGKSGGYRVIYAIHEESKICYLLTIYAKSQKENISTAEIEDLLLDLENYLLNLDNE
ncbi:MAG: type II toxin-antitoxin system RelE/ParE family toxin [Chloroflexota bacterium]